MKALLKVNITFSYCLIWKHVAVQTDWVLCSMFPHSELHVRGLLILKHHFDSQVVTVSWFLPSLLRCFHLLHLLHLPLVQLHIVFLVFQREPHWGGWVCVSPSNIKKIDWFVKIKLDLFWILIQSPLILGGGGGLWLPPVDRSFAFPPFQTPDPVAAWLMTVCSALTDLF